MPATETSILSDFLLTPAALPTIVSLRKFTELFPHSQQSNPKIQELYRDLQHQRAVDIDDVKHNIASEVRRGERDRREVMKARRAAENEELQGIDLNEIHMETEVRQHLFQACIVWF
jgi:centromere-localized protein 2